MHKINWQKRTSTPGWNGLTIAAINPSSLGAGIMAHIGSLVNDVVKSITRERA